MSVTETARPRPLLPVGMLLFAVCVVLLVLWSLTQRPQVEGEPALPNDPSGSVPSYLESNLVALINGRRAALGLGTLHATYPLGLVARYHATDIGAEGLCQHDAPPTSLAGTLSPATRFAFLNYPGIWRGEVVGCRVSTPEQAVELWWQSPPHRSILTTPSIDEIGCGWWQGQESAWQTCEVAQLSK